MSENTYSDRLVEYLVALEERGDRAVLATLRSSLRAGHELDALRIVLPFLPPGAGRQREDDAILLAGLFALHPNNGDLSLAEALRGVMAEGSDSIEGRFRALLSSSRAELGTHLRHAVSLVASKKLPVNWTDLHRAIRCWEHEDDRVRRDWAEAFWTPEYDGDTATKTAHTSI